MKSLLSILALVVVAGARADDPKPYITLENRIHNRAPEAHIVIPAKESDPIRCEPTGGPVVLEGQPEFTQCVCRVLRAATHALPGDRP